MTTSIVIATAYLTPVALGVSWTPEPEGLAGKASVGLAESPLGLRTLFSAYQAMA